MIVNKYPKKSECRNAGMQKAGCRNAGILKSRQIPFPDLGKGAGA
jgi:hypothetical protein